MPVFASFPSRTSPQLAWVLAASTVLLGLGLSAAAQTPAPAVATTGTTAAAPTAGTEAGALKNLAFSGDVQVQDDDFSGGLANRSLDRDRLRYRVRLNLTSQLSTDFSAGIGLASGDVNDPVATSQDATGFYTRKPLDLNLAWLQYHPHAFSPLTIQGGKFTYPFHTTQLIWDQDLNPEGLAETLAFPLRGTGALKKITLVGFQLPFSEVAGVSVNDKSIAQDAVYGGQIQTNWKLTRGLSFEADSAFYNYHDADPIALALETADLKNPETPGQGLLPLTSGLTPTNSIVTTTATDVVTVNGTAYPTGVTNISSAQFASKFGLFETLAKLNIETASPKWPLALTGDFVQNTEACANEGNIAPPPANTASVHYTQTTNVACDPHQRRGHWLEVQFGRGKQAGDWQLSYTHTRIESEAVLSNFDYNNLRQGTDVLEHIATAAYQLHRNVQLSLTGLIGRPLDPAPNETWLRRFDTAVTYSF